MAKQIKLKTLDNNMIHGGILLENGNCICGCCGNELLAEHEKKRSSKPSWELLEQFKTWVNISEEIIGE